MSLTINHALHLFIQADCIVGSRLTHHLCHVELDRTGESKGQPSGRSRQHFERLTFTMELAGANAFVDLDNIIANPYDWNIRITDMTVLERQH
ncbi:uncharacterized protein SPSK_10106 [Sporothrix schenckii 1099-18]|uniref:Uncharacterized protein n=1 Tax=Sporothrix schenckii 1099-18 TaxID=1397361 RepID=A0A0F2M5G1_SPOSC|nr:uncharacterized protein SPSK_10106 [Sporothrix schenckii 1099-18]KJR84344.1 hypothetical protein SPSK_10106 [Sporothrix schenckii 1099-18]